MMMLRLLALGLVLGALGWWLLAPDQELDRGDAAAETVQGSTPATAPSDVSAVNREASAAPLTLEPSAPAGAALGAAAPVAAAPASLTTATGPGLLLPVQGIGADQLQDTFTDARSEGRVHDAIDILAPSGTPVLAVADGTVEKLFNSERGGLTVYQFEPSGRYCYYYAHLDRYADGLAEKKTIKRGDVIGYVGSTGNANPAAPHLHFEIHLLGPEKQWWKGASINPYPVLRGDKRLD